MHSLCVVSSPVIAVSRIYVYLNSLDCNNSLKCWFDFVVNMASKVAGPQAPQSQVLMA
jgi:hypothetical protein